ncbi:MAG: hypothetical protein ACE5HV_18640 [Acidobacteriota bacterium]
MTFLTGGADNINAVWSRDGTEIFYRSGPGQLSVVEVTSEPELSFSAPRMLFEVAGFQSAFDVSADGQRFLGTIPAPTTEPVAVLSHGYWRWRFAGDRVPRTRRESAM